MMTAIIFITTQQSRERKYLVKHGNELLGFVKQSPAPENERSDFDARDRPFFVYVGALGLHIGIPIQHDFVRFRLSF